jgi:dextranase
VGEQPDHFDGSRSMSFTGRGTQFGLGAFSMLLLMAVPMARADDNTNWTAVWTALQKLDAAALPVPSADRKERRTKSFLSRADAQPTPLAIRVEKVSVQPGEPNTLQVEDQTAGVATLRIQTPLGRIMHESRHQTASGRLRLGVPPLPTEGGYLVDLEIDAAGVRTAGTTVISVAKNIAADLRYGFYCDYRPGCNADAQAARLADLHVNAVEFYDYFPAHGSYAPHENTYVFEPFGVRIDGRTVRRKIEAGHTRNILAIAYVAAYAASRSVFEKHPFPMTDASGVPKIFNGRVMSEAAADAEAQPKWFWLMNVADDSPWHRHIMAEFSRAIDDSPDDLVSFDGFEIDTYGDANNSKFYAAHSRRNGDRLVDVLHDFVADVRDTARKVKPRSLVSFNSVDEFGADVMQGVTDFVFLEIWRRHTPCLTDLVDICHRYRGPGRQRVILKLYPADMDPTQKAWPAGSLAFVLGAAMTGGGSLMAVGEPDADNRVMHGLNTLYYPDHTPLVSGNEELVRAYHRHDALWFGYTHGPEVHNTALASVADGCLTRTYAAPNHSAIVVQLLRRSPDGRWTTPAALPEPVEDLEVAVPMLVKAVPKQVFYSSPDRDGLARPAAVQFAFDKERIVIRIPEFHVHGTVVLQY